MWVMKTTNSVTAATESRLAQAGAVSAEQAAEAAAERREAATLRDVLRQERRRHAAEAEALRKEAAPGGGSLRQVGVLTEALEARARVQRNLTAGWSQAFSNFALFLKNAAGSGRRAP